MKSIKKTVQKAVVRKVFSPCGTCGKPNSPGHTCRMKFNQQNVTRLNNRRNAR